MISRCSCLIDQPDAMNRRRQMVEQFGMRGPLAQQAEIAGRADDAAAEMVLPDAVDDHAGRQRVVAAGDGPGQFEPSAPLA